MDPKIQSEYHRLRQLGWSPNDAMDAAKITVEFDEFERQRLVKFEVLPDEISNFDDLAGDLSEKVKKELEVEIERHGLWEIQTSFRVNPKERFEYADGVCGFVGNSWKDSGYDLDCKKRAIRALKATQEILWSEEAEELAKRPTYAG